MPVARFEMPDGRVARFEVAEGITPEQAQQLIEAEIAGMQSTQSPEQAEPQQPAQPPSGYDQASQGIADIGSTIGGNITDAARDVFAKPFNAVQSAAGAVGAMASKEAEGWPAKKAFLQELAASGNRSITEIVDFMGPDFINALMRVTGNEGNVPRLTDVLESGITGGGYMEPGIARDAVQGFGESLGAAGSMVSVPRNLAKIGPALAEFMGVGSAAPVSPAVAAEVAQNLALRRGSGDKSLAKLTLDEAGNTIKDKTAAAAIWQGFSDGLVQMSKTASKQTRSKMAAMLNIKEKGIENLRYAADNRPLDVVGDSILNRVKVVREANRNAGTRLDGIAESLKGSQVDHSPAINSFLGKLEKMGMVYDPSTRTLGLVEGSTTQDMPKVHKEAKRILNRLHSARNPSNPDGYDVHVMKGWLDNNLDYAKQGGQRSKGMIGKLERATKDLRHDLDSILDTNFPDYDAVNKQYAETIGALDDLQKVAGTKFNMQGPNADKAMGTLSRRLLSNAQSRTILDDAIDQVDTVARKYLGGGPPGKALVPFKGIDKRTGVSLKQLDDDDVKALVQFDDQLNKVFGTSSQTSLLGDFEKGTEKSIRAVAGGPRSMAMEGVVSGAKKLAGINEKNAIKAMRELLNGKSPGGGGGWK